MRACHTRRLLRGPGMLSDNPTPDRHIRTRTCAPLSAPTRCDYPREIRSQPAHLPQWTASCGSGSTEGARTTPGNLRFLPRQRESPHTIPLTCALEPAHLPLRACPCLWITPRIVDNSGLQIAQFHIPPAKARTTPGNLRFLPQVAHPALGWAFKPPLTQAARNPVHPNLRTLGSRPSATDDALRSSPGRQRKLDHLPCQFHRNSLPQLTLMGRGVSLRTCAWCRFRT